MSTYFCDWCRAEHDALTAEQIKGLYSHVIKTGRFPTGVADVRHVEHVLKTSIESTAEFHRLVNEYIIKQSGTKLTDGQRLRQKRVRSGMTQAVLARSLGITKMAVSHYEKGSRPMPKQALEWLNSDDAPSGGK